MKLFTTLNSGIGPERNSGELPRMLRWMPERTSLFPLKKMISYLFLVIFASIFSEYLSPCPKYHVVLREVLTILHRQVLLPSVFNLQVRSAFLILTAFVARTYYTIRRTGIIAYSIT